MKSLREDGWRLVGEGITTPDEVMRNTKDEAASLAAYAEDGAAGNGKAGGSIDATTEVVEYAAASGRSE
jgi:hypothetical protein